MNKKIAAAFRFGAFTTSFWLLLLGQSLRAEEAVPILTLADCLRLALEKGPEIAIARGEYQAAQSKWDAVRIGFWVPKVSLQFTAPGFEKSQDFQSFVTGRGFSIRELAKTTSLNFQSGLLLNQNLITGGTIALSAQPNFQRFDANIYPDFRRFNSGLALALDQPIFKASPNRTELKTAEISWLRARIQYHQRIAEITRDAYKAYFDLLTYAKQEEIARLTSEKSTLDFASLKVKLEAGLIDEKDFLAGQTEVTDYQLQVLDAKRKSQAGRSNLAVVIGWEPQMAFGIADQMDVDTVSSDWFERIRKGRAQNLEIKKAEYLVKEKKEAASQTAMTAGVDGSLTMNVNLGRGRERRLENLFDTTGTFLGTAWRTQDVNTSRWEVALQFIIPLWDGGSRSSSLASARLAVKTAELELEKKKTESQLKVDELVDHLRYGSQKIVILKRQVELFKKAEENAWSKKIAGLLDERGLYSAQIDRLNAEVKYISTVSDYIQTRYELLRYVADFDLLPTVSKN